MREIKFRCWDNIKKEWIDRSVTHLNLIDGWVHNHVIDDGYKDAILMQYTGLKDKNGVEIYEGDILKHIGSTGTIHSNPYGMPRRSFKDEIVYVLNLKCGFSLRHISSCGNKDEYTPSAIILGWEHVDNYRFWNFQAGFEVIGNIHENKDLL